MNNFFKLLHPQGQIIDVKMRKIAINRPFFLPIIVLVRELLTSNMHAKFEEDT